MTITKVKYERLFPCGAYTNEKIGFEAEIGFVSIIDEELNGLGIHPQRSETPEDVIEQLRQLAENIHKEKYPQYYQHERQFEEKYTNLGVTIPSQYDAVDKPLSVPMENMDKIQAFIEVINSKYQTKKTLENLKSQIDKENNEKLTEAYNNKLKSFQ